MEGMTPERPVISERLRFTLAEMKAEGVMGWPNVISDAIAHIDAQAKQIEQLQADNRLQKIFLRGKSGCEREMLKFYECLKLIKERLICDATLMDERGRGNPENNSVMLWKREWDELRKSLYKSNELISGIIAEFDEVERKAIDNANKSK